jgi:hypothetical protein
MIKYKNKINEEYEKLKYISTLTHPEKNSDSKIPSNSYIPTVILKRRKRLDFTTNATGLICIQWSPQQFYFSNIGVFLYNAVGYTGTASGTPTTTGLGTDSTGFLPTGTPIRLVGASMIVSYTGGDSQRGIFSGGVYQTFLSTATGDNGMTIFNRIDNIRNSLTVNAKDGLKMIYTPYDNSCFNFYPINTDLGKNGAVGNGLLSTERFIVYGSGLNTSSTCISVVFTQIFEAITINNDYFNPYPYSFMWEPANYIKKYISDKYLKVVNNLKDEDNWNYMRNLLIEVQKDNICKRNFNPVYFFNPLKIINFRLPSQCGEETVLFHQTCSLDITTNTNGFFCVSWFPQFMHSSGNASQTGFYLVNNSGYNGTASTATVTSQTTFDYAAFSSPIFQAVRLVAATMKIKYISTITLGSGQIHGGINIEQPPFTTPATTNYDLGVIQNLLFNEKYFAFDGMKIIYIPHDYSCFNFYPQDFLLSSNNNNETIAQSFYVCGYLLPSNTKCIRIAIDRLFEGIVNPIYEDYYSGDTSDFDLTDFNNMTQKLLNKNMVISKLSDEYKIIKELTK